MANFAELCLNLCRRALAPVRLAGAIRPRSAVRSSGLSGLLVDHPDEVANARHGLLAEARAVEDAVVAESHLEVIKLLPLGNVHAQFVGRVGLAYAGNVVVLALDR